MATLTTIENPFDPFNSKVVTEIESGKPIYSSIKGFHCYFDVAVSLNGQLTDDFEYVLKEDDHIGFLAIPQGGDGKNPWAAVAMVALMVAAPYAGAFAGIVFGSTLAASVVTAGVMIGGGMLINSLLPPPTPDLGGLSGNGLQDSPTYSWAETQNPMSEGNALPLVYGKTRMTPLVISQYVEVYDDKQYLNILYALNDGEILSVTDIEINGNPLAYYDNVTSSVRLGTNTQTLIPSFDNTRIDNAVSVRLTTTETIRTTTNNAVSGLSIVIAATGGLYYANDTGGLDSRTVALEIKYRESGGLWVTIPSTSISGATNNTIREVFTVNDLAPATYDVSVRRTVVESTAVRTREAVYFEALTEIIYDDFTYPNTALLAIRALATDQLSGSTPRVTCVVDRGSGLSNPALAAKNIIQLIGGSVNTEKFTEWETFCNTEAFTCNIVFDSGSTVRDALNAVSLLGRATVIPIGAEYVPIIDKPEALPTQRFLFGMGNIATDSFEESYLPLADRTNIVEMTYFDENLGYERQSIEVYQNGFDESIDTARRAAITLFGCVNRRMAIRYARFLLNKNRYLTNTVTFEADMDAIACSIGDVIDVAHDVPQWGYSGRITSITDTLAGPSLWVFEAGVYVDGVFIDGSTLVPTITLDRELTFEAGVTYYFTVKFDDDDSRETVQIMSPVAVTTNELFNLTGFSKPLTAMMNYSFGTPDRETKQFRVSEITRSSDQKRKITAIEYITEVYEDSGDAIPAINSSSLASVTALQATSYYKTDINGVSENVVDLTWIGVGIGWNVFSRIQGELSWVFEGYTTRSSFKITGVPSGTYEYRVGDKIATLAVAELPAAPSITNVVPSPRYTGVQFELTYTVFPEFSHVEVWEATLAQTILDAVLVGTTDSKIYQRYGLGVVDSRNYWFRIVDIYGNKGLYFGAVVGSTSTNITNILLDLKAQQGNPAYLPALSDILITGFVAGVPSLGLSGDLFIDGTVSANALAVMGLSTFVDDIGASGGTTIFRQPLEPSLDLVEGDLWYDTDDNNRVYWYDGIDFVEVSQDAAQAINNNATTILGSKITTGSIYAAQIATGTLTADKIAANTITAAQIAANTITSTQLTTGIALIDFSAQSTNYSWNAGNPIGFGLFSTGDTASGQAYNIVGGSIYGAELTGSTLNIEDINLKDALGTTISSHFSGRGRVSLDSPTLPKVMSIFFDFYAGDDNRISAFKTLETGSYLSIGSEADSASFGVIQRDGMEFLFTSDDSTITCGFYAGGDLIGSTTSISGDPDSHLGVGFSRFTDNIGGDTYSYYIHTKSVITAYELNGNGYLEMRFTSDTTMGTFLSQGFKLDYSISNM